MEIMTAFLENISPVRQAGPGSNFPWGCAVDEFLAILLITSTSELNIQLGRKRLETPVIV